MRNIDLNRLNKAAFKDMRNNVMDDSTGMDDEQKRKGLFGWFMSFHSRMSRDVFQFLSLQVFFDNWGKMFVMFFFNLILCAVGPGLAIWGLGILIGASNAWHWIGLVALIIAMSGWWLFVPWYFIVTVKISFPLLKLWAKLPDTNKKNDKEKEGDDK